MKFKYPDYIKDPVGCARDLFPELPSIQVEQRSQE